MSESDIREDVRQLLAQQIESVVQLEVLLLLHTHADRSYTARQLAAELRIDAAGAEEQLAGLCQHKLLSCTAEATRAYRFDPTSPTVSETVAALAREYDQRRVTIISLIYSKPADKIKIFTDAFRIRKEKHNDR